MERDLIAPHVDNARGCALRALKKSNRGGGVKGFLLRRALGWFAKRLKKSVSLTEITDLVNILLAILTFVKGVPWISEKWTVTIDVALKALQELRQASAGG